MHYGWFYFRKSPRGNNKFGVTHLLWERLRMQQQGTDEEIQFDRVWLVQAPNKETFSKIEKQLKTIYQPRCLHNTTKRAGHTEWYKNINLKEFNNHLAEITRDLKCKVVNVKLKTPYTATSAKQCPLGLPTNDRFKGKEFIQEWTDLYWRTLIEPK